MFAFASSNESTHLSITWTPVNANIQFSLSLIYPMIGVMQSRMGKDQRQIIIIRCKFAFDKYAAHCATLTFSPWHEIGTSDKACVGLSLCFFYCQIRKLFRLWILVSNGSGMGESKVQSLTNTKLQKRQQCSSISLWRKLELYICGGHWVGFLRDLLRKESFAWIF